MRQLADVRKKQILEISLKLAQEIGYGKITRQRIAGRANVSVSLITYHFKTMTHLKKLIIQNALKRDIKSIIVQAIIQDDPFVKKLSINYKQKILKAITYAI